jgi:23S rRNA pseudouridine1911/1915/1917 synthase
MTDTRTIRFTVSPSAVGARLDAVLADRDEMDSRAEAQRLIEDGAVLVNGEPRAKRYRLAAGDAIEVSLGPPPRTPGELRAEDLDVPIVFADEHIVVVDKPAGMVTHPSKGHDEGTLVHGLLGAGIAGGDDPDRPGIVHRLDRDTSGLMLVARTERAHRRLGRMMRDRDIERRYLALVHGEFPPALTIDRPIGRDPRRRTRQAVVQVGGKEAITHFRTVERVGNLTLVEARLETGRTHQVRVHLEAAGHPVVGDPLYGQGRAAHGLDRQFLHAYRLGLPHPETGEEMSFESPLPEDLEAALAAARVRAAEAG